MPLGNIWSGWGATDSPNEDAYSASLAHLEQSLAAQQQAIVINQQEAAMHHAQQQAQYGLAAYAAMPPPSQNMSYLLDTLSRYSSAGIISVVVSPTVFAQLCHYLSHYNTISEGLSYIQINTGAGAVNVVCEGKGYPSSQNFDKYMEDVDEHTP
jgi:hypothetical protein